MKRIVFKIFDKIMGTYTGTYSRIYHEDYEFGSKSSAMAASQGIVRDAITYELHEVSISEKVIKKHLLK